MHYTFHQLKVFCTVCRHKSVTKAAEELHLTQPAVSIQLKKLQEQFDIALTEVIGRKLHITDFGRKIAELGERTLHEAGLIDDTANQYKGLMTGKIKISLVSTAKYVMPYFLTDYVHEFPNVELSVNVTNKNLVIESLARNETDFALVSVLPDLALEAVELMENRLQLIAGDRYFHYAEGLDIDELSRLPLIFREQGSATRTAMESFLNDRKIEPFRRLELVSNEAVKQAVSAGLGLSIMPLIGLRNEINLGTLKIISFEGLPIITSWKLVYAKGKNLSPAARVLLDHIKKNKQEVIDRHFGG